MPVSFGMLGILLMLDICFIVNYLFVRACRHWANRIQQQKDAQVAQLMAAAGFDDIEVKVMIPGMTMLVHGRKPA